MQPCWTGLWDGSRAAQGWRGQHFPGRPVGLIGPSGRPWKGGLLEKLLDLRALHCLLLETTLLRTNLGGTGFSFSLQKASFPWPLFLRSTHFRTYGGDAMGCLDSTPGALIQLHSVTHPLPGPVNSDFTFPIGSSMNEFKALCQLCGAGQPPMEGTSPIRSQEAGISTQAICRADNSLAWAASEFSPQELTRKGEAITHLPTSVW